MKNYFDKIIFVTNLTVQPTRDEVDGYLQKVTKEILTDSENELWVMGRMTEHINTNLLTEKTTVFHSIAEIVNKL